MPGLLEHGGQLNKAANTHNIPVHQWLDLSTGINPHHYPITTPHETAWTRLPEQNDGLHEAACDYYQTTAVLPVAGSQAAIMALPRLRLKGRVGLLSPSYFEHHLAWARSGHDVTPINPEQIDAHIQHLDVLLIVNPNNPTGQRFSRQQLLSWHHTLAKKSAWLIVDEAFIDSTPEDSLASKTLPEGLIILRSIGKFFGLAGIRSGFVLAHPSLIKALDECLGPWTVPGPTRQLVQQALTDPVWQAQTRDRLRAEITHLISLLSSVGLPPHGHTDLFAWVKTPQHENLHLKLAKQGILTRHFTQPGSLRFGLPKRPQDWQRLKSALTASLDCA